MTQPPLYQSIEEVDGVYSHNISSANMSVLLLPISYSTSLGEKVSIAKDRLLNNPEICTQAITKVPHVHASGICH